MFPYADVNLKWRNEKGEPLSVADPEGGGGGLGGLNPPSEVFFKIFACQYMKIPTDLDLPPPPPFEEFWPRTPPPPLKEFLDPPLPFITGDQVSK